MKKFALMGLACASLMFTGCGTTTLQSGGAYTDKTLYTADQTITTSYTVFDTFLKWELTNRAALASVPEVTKFADSIRVNAQKWFSTAEALRDTYAANPTGTNANNLNAAVALISTALAQASQYISTTAITTPTK